MINYFDNYISKMTMQVMKPVLILHGFFTILQFFLNPACLAGNSKHSKKNKFYKNYRNVFTIEHLLNWSVYGTLRELSS